MNKTSNEIAEVPESVKKPSSNIIISDIVTREYGYNPKVDEVNKMLEEICGKKGIPLTQN